jgi:hypothetical protein
MLLLMLLLIRYFVMSILTLGKRKELPQLRAALTRGRETGAFIISACLPRYLSPALLPRSCVPLPRTGNPAHWLFHLLNRQ